MYLEHVKAYVCNAYFEGWLFFSKIQNTSNAKPENASIEGIGSNAMV
jgi:hypothetical protein